MHVNHLLSPFKLLIFSIWLVDIAKCLRFTQLAIQELVSDE